MLDEQGGGKTDAETRNKANFKRLIDEVINTGRLDRASELLTVDRPDYQDFGLPPDLTKGYSGFERVVGMLREAFPDLRFTSEFMVAEGDKVLSFNRIEGTHRGAFMGMSPSGKTFTATSADICSFDKEGMITAHWGVFDVFAMMVQLGAIPMPARSA